MTYAAALPILLQEWSMSGAAAGGIASGYQMGYAVSLFVFSGLADRVGAKPLYLISFSAAALFSLAFAIFARGYLSALILHTLVAISLGGTYTTALMILANQYPPERRGMASGYFIASSSLGYMLSLVLSGFAIPLGGYKLSFFLTSLGPLSGAMITWLTLSKTKVSIAEREKKQSFKKEVLGNKPGMLLIGAYSFHSWELLGMWAWTPAFLFSCLTLKGEQALGAAGFSSYLTSALHLSGMFASFSMGSLSDRLGRARVILLLSGISAACSFIFGWSISWPFVLVVCIGLVYAFVSLGDSPVLSAALTEVITPSYLGAAFGLRSLLGFGAGAISPLVFGIILDFTNPNVSGQEYYLSWGWAFGSLGLGGLGAVWAANRLRKISHPADKIL
jgi:MFS family permease